MALVGPFSVGYPVKFKSSGDTTRDAFGKHIQEIERIYGYLNALDAGKVSASDVIGLSGSISGLNSTISNLNTALTNHINSSNPHPNYKPSVSWSNLTNKPQLEDIDGTLDAGRITNLPNFGLISWKLTQNGHVEFYGGLIINWGKKQIENPYDISTIITPVVFEKAFKTQCFAVTIADEWTGSTYYKMTQAKNITKTGFDYVVRDIKDEGQTDYWKYMYCNYIAIGV